MQAIISKIWRNLGSASSVSDAWKSVSITRSWPKNLVHKINLALCTVQRVQTLSKIRLENIQHREKGLHIKITDILKTSIPKSTQPILQLPFFTEKTNLCAATTILHYIERTKSLRGNESYLFITTTKPHKRVSTQTLSRWIKEGLERGGVNIEKFKGHSTRHAATSAALRTGINIEAIRNAAGWSQKSHTFCKFYNKPINDANEHSFADYINRINGWQIS